MADTNSKDHVLRWIGQNTKIVRTARAGHAAWVHVSLEQVETAFPKIPFGKYCETPRCADKLHKASVFQAVIYPDHSDCWVSCLQCHELMQREWKRSATRPMDVP